MNFKIATYNIHHGLKLSKVIDNIERLSKDGVVIFCLQEIREFTGEVNAVANILRSLGRGWDYETFIEPDSYNFGLCVIWKKDNIKLKKIEKIVLPRIPSSNIRVMVKKIKKPLDRGVLILDFKINKELVRISNVHLDCHGQFIHRERQLRSLVKHLKDLKLPAKEIICGDFNTIGAEAISKKQEKKILDILGKNFVNAHPKGTPTFRLLQRLDYIFVKNIKVNGAKVLRLKGSDHFPLIANLEL